MSPFFSFLHRKVNPILTFFDSQDRAFKKTNPWPRKESKTVLCWKHRKCLGLILAGSQSSRMARSCKSCLCWMSLGSGTLGSDYIQSLLTFCSMFWKGASETPLNLGELFHVTWNSYHTRQVCLLRGTERVLMKFTPARAPPDKQRHKTRGDFI